MHDIRLFKMQQLHQGLLAIPVIRVVPSRRYESITQELIACGRDLNRLKKDVDVTDMHELASKHSTCLPYDPEGTMTLGFSHVPVDESFGSLSLVQDVEFFPVLFVNLNHSVIRTIGNVVYVM